MADCTPGKARDGLSAACTCISALATDPACPQHGTTVRTQPDFIIDGKPYEGECIFPDLEVSRDAAS